METDDAHITNRRDLLKGALATGVLAGVGPKLLAAGGGEHSTARPSDLIRAENEKPGTLEWMLTNTRVDPKSQYRCPWIEGYCSRTSVRVGEKLSIMVSTNPASPFTIDIYRLGYYGGSGGRHVQKLGSFNGSVQPDPEVGPDRLRECLWEPAVTIEIPTDWLSGVYVGKLTAEREGLQSYVIFIVRDDRQCDFLFQCSDSTWLAYNRWPNEWAMYNDGRDRWYIGPGVQVSWDRPYANCCHRNNLYGSQGSGQFLLFEFPLAYWMEKEGYDVSYISTLDTHSDGLNLLRAKSFLSVGHDEYWSRNMYDNMLAAVAGGMSAAFFSGDTCWGIIPFLPSTSGVASRIITRLGQFGPLDPRAMKEYPELKLFKESAPTEANLIGARNVWPYVGVGDWICSDEKHWIFAGTGMKNGDGIPNLVGWEWMGEPADIPGLEVVSKGMVKDFKKKAEYAATLYPGPKGNCVFNAGTVWWSDGLSAPPGYKSPDLRGIAPNGPDLRAQQITANLLNRFRGSS